MPSDEKKQKLSRRDLDGDRPIQRCPVCGSEMSAIAGSKDAICGNCGFKESCC